MIHKLLVIIARWLFLVILNLLTACRSRWATFLDPEKQKIYFANHGSNLDFPVIWAALPKQYRIHLRPVAARDYWNADFIRRFLSVDVLRAVHIDRIKSERIHDNPLEPIQAALKDGSSILIFPEGTRSLTGEIGTFKAGLYFLAKEFPNAELVPLYLHNLNRILPKGEIAPVPFIATMWIGSPLTVHEQEAKEVFLYRARDAMVALKGMADAN